MAEETTVFVPDIGDFQDVEVIEVLVAAGDTIAPEDPLITLESDKATMEVPAPQAGIVSTLSVKVGDRVSAGTPILELAPAQTKQGAETNNGTASQPSSREEEPSSAAATALSESSGDYRPPPVEALPTDRPGVGKPHASPGVRKFARELGVDLTVLQGSGPKGRITREDVQGYVKGELSVSRATPRAGGTALPAIPTIDFSKFGTVETVALARIRRIAGANLHRSWLNVPHVTHHDEADITELEAFRLSLKSETAERGMRLTLLSFLMKAAVAALQRHERFNASLDASGEQLVLKRYFHLGVAVDTPDGLVVPVVRDVDRKGIWELSEELAALGTAARGGKLTPSQMQGASFTISSLGGIGGTAFTPIVNAPEVAILGVSRSAMKPVWRNGEFEPRLIVPLSLSYDHRVIDGAEAARFTALLGTVLGDIRRLLL